MEREPGSTLTLFYEGREGLVQLQFVNDKLELVPQTTRGVPTGPLTKVNIDPASYIASLQASPLQFTIPVTYVRGGWTVTAKILE
jgi:hypothetical protein